MVNGSNPSMGQSKYCNYTGLSIARPVAVNPTNEEYKEITGQECPYTLNYEYVELGDQGKFFPISFLMKNQETGLYNFLRFLVSNRTKMSKNGSIQFINDLGNTTWAQSPEMLANNPKMSWFTNSPFRPLQEGFCELHNFLITLTMFDNRMPEVNWIADMEAANINAETIFDHADVSGLRSLIAWANKEDHSIVCLYSVKETVKNDNPVFYQHIEAGSASNNLFFRSVRGPEHGISAYTKKMFNEMCATKSKEGFNITSRHFSTNFTEFVAPEISNVASNFDPEALSNAIQDVV